MKSKGVNVMQKAAITVLATDRLGIVCEVSNKLASLECNIEDISQTVLQDEFAGIFLLEVPENLTLDQLDSTLKEELIPLGVFPFVKSMQEKDQCKTVSSEPFVIISMGPDRVGLIAAISCIMKQYNVNITNLQFAHRSSSFVNKAVTIYEVEIPRGIKLSEFVNVLREKAKSVGLEVSVQHKKIFEDICRL